jgi:hypothetical protein
MKAGTSTSIKVPAIVDVDPGDFSSDTCGEATWSTPPSDAVMTVTESPAISGKGNKNCLRTDNLTVTISRAANEPIPSPSPGQMIDQQQIIGMDQELSVGGYYGENPTITVNLYEPASLQISDLNIPGSNQAINSPNPAPSVIMVGQQVNLEGIPLGGRVVNASGVSPGTITWTFGTDDTTSAVGGYAPCQCTSVPSPSPVQPAPLYALNFPVYYTTAGTHTIKASASVQCCGDATFSVGAPVAVSVVAKYPVKAPTVTAASASSTAQTTVSIYYGSKATATNVACTTQNGVNPQFLLALHAGDQCLPHAIDWTFRVETPSWGKGNIAVVQLSNITISGIENSAPTSTFQEAGLDGIYPYAAWAPTSGGLADPAFDAPADSLVSTECTTVTRNDTFLDYFVYQASSPAPGVAGRPSIPVTLRKYQWGWGGTTSRPTPTPLPTPLTSPTPSPGPSPTFGTPAPVSNPNPTEEAAPYDLPSWSEIPQYQFGTAPC